MQKNINNQKASVFFIQNKLSIGKREGKKAMQIATLFHPIAGFLNDIAIFQESPGFGTYKKSDLLEGFLTINEKKAVFNVTRHVVAKKNRVAA